MAVNILREALATPTSAILPNKLLQLNIGGDTGRVEILSGF
jgi:hypothetical protein